MKRVVYYARVSTEEADQLSAFGRQKEELEDFINSEEEWELIGNYVDEGKSGTSDKGRKGYQKLFQDLETDKFEIVVIKDISRLSRDTLNWYLFIDRLVKNEKKLYFYDSKSFYHPDDQLLTGIRALMAAQFSRDLSKKINDANKKRAKEGGVITNGKLWGYNQFKGKLTINEDQADVVRKVFDMYADGLGFRRIVQELTILGITNQNGNTFSLTTLKRMIKNEKYKGTLISNKKHKDFDTKKINIVAEDKWIIIENGVPEIVNVETWEKANNVLYDKRKIYKSNETAKARLAGYFKGSYAYSGKIKCGTCGESYWHQIYNYRTKKGRNKNDLWQCSTFRSFGKKTENGCRNPHIQTLELDKMVKNTIFDVWNNRDEIIDKIIKILDETLEKGKSKEEIKKYEAEIAKNEKRSENLINMRMNEEISKEEFAKQKEKVESILLNLKNQIFEFEESFKGVTDRKKRLLYIKEFLGEKLKSSEGINDEIISNFLKEVIIKEDGDVAIVLDGGFNFIFKKVGKEYILCI